MGIMSKPKRTPMQKRFRNYYKGGRQLYRDISYLKSIINVETKWNTAIINPSATTAGTLTLLSGIVPGDDAINRNGRSIKCTSSAINMSITINALATRTYLRMFLVQCWDVKAVAPTFAQLLATVDVNGHRNRDTMASFNVVKDFRVVLSTDSPIKYVKFYKKFKNYHIRYNSGSAGTIADCTDGALYLFVISSEASNGPNIDAHHRLSFVDN